MKKNIARFVTAAGALAVACGAFTCAKDQGEPSAGLSSVVQGASSLLSPAPAFAKTQDGVVLADVAERVVSSVVNISSEKVVRETGSAPSFGPLLNDPFFRHFFGPGLEAPQRQPREQREHSLGSGVVVTADGVILTNNHVIEHADKIRVALSDGREFDAKVVGTDPESDLGVLRLEQDDGKKVENLKPLAMGNSSQLRLGDVVLAVGDPFGVGQTVTMGIVSAKGRANVGIEQYEDFIQTDAAINPGNSGGALVNMRGELVGINTAIISRSGGYQGVGFAIPSNMAEPIMKSLLEDGTVKRGWLGVGIQDLTPELADALGIPKTKGVLVSQIESGSPAAKAGLQAKDVILKLNGQVMDSSAHLRNAVAAAGANAKVELQVLRDKEQKTITVVLDQKKSAHAPT
jgi:serine protease Do